MISHIKDPNSESCIVFIHCLVGSESSWLNFVNYLNRKWNYDFGLVLKYFTYYKEIILRSDKRSTNNLTRYLYKFWFFLLKISSQRNTENAKELANYIKEHCTEFNNIYIVAHSMGGLIARQYLVDCRKEDHDIRRFKALITYSTPHVGSTKARIISFGQFWILKPIYKLLLSKTQYRLLPQLGDLNPKNNFIKELNLNWSHYGIEKKLKFYRVVGSCDFFVSKKSAALNNSDVENVFEFKYNHSGIINPKVSDTNFEPIDLLLERFTALDETEDLPFDDLDLDIEDSQDEDSY